jgi:chromate reductase, NAD(P)H dehydrogenase (quinone)
MTKLVMISGSLRSASTNSALVRAAAQSALVHPDVEDVQVASIRTIPSFDQDVEDAGDPPAVLALKELVSAADAVLISTPEYNSSVPGVLKNALDWLSRPYGESSLTGKPVATISASPSQYGARWAQEHLHVVLRGAGARVLNTDCVVVAASDQCVRDDRVVDPDVLHVVQGLVAQTVAACTRQPAA